MSRLRVFTRIRINKEVFIFLFFLFLSAGYWVLSILKADIESELKVDIRLVGIPPEYIISDSIPKFLKVTVRDKGRQLATYNNRDTPIDIPFQNLKLENSQLLFDSRTLELLLKKELSASAEILSIQPSIFVLECLQVSGRKLPICLDFDFSTSAETMVSGPVEQSADSVTLYAPASILQKMKCVRTEKKFFRSLTDTLRTKLRFVPHNKMRYEFDEVELMIPVERYTQKIISQPIEIKNAPLGYIIRIFPQSATISCLVPLSKFHNLRSDHFVVRLDFDSELNRQHKKQILQLHKFPEWVMNPALEVDSVDVILEKLLN